MKSPYVVLLFAVLSLGVGCAPAPTASEVSDTATAMTEPATAAPANPSPPAEAIATSVQSSNPKACLLEGKFEAFGQQFDISDCVQNDGVPHEGLVAACDGISQMSIAFGIPAPKTTWLDKCPDAAQARCLNMNGTQLTGYYYKRPADDLPNVKGSCEMMGGRYAEGG